MRLLSLSPELTEAIFCSGHLVQCSCAGRDPLKHAWRCLSADDEAAATGRLPSDEPHGH